MHLPCPTAYLANRHSSFRLELAAMMDGCKKLGEYWYFSNVNNIFHGNVDPTEHLQSSQFHLEKHHLMHNNLKVSWESVKE